MFDFYTKSFRGGFTYLLFLGLLIFNFPTAAAAAAAVVVAQSKTGASGNWEWTSRPARNKSQTYFSAEIKQTGSKVSGKLWFNMIGDEEGSDASFVPFVGTISGNTIRIEFDPKDLHGIEEEKVRYKKPKSPSTATLQLKNGKLEWTQTKGILDDLKLGVPRQFVMRRRAAGN
jgi:hypothetical protein